MFNKKQKGFTLIELLVVIAIIGLLAGIVLVSLGGARDSAKDARITAEMGSLRTQAEIFATDSGTGYVGFGGSAPIQTALTDINTQNGPGGPVVFNESAIAYCAEVEMNDGWYCIDNTFVSGKFTADPSCSATDLTCN